MTTTEQVSVLFVCMGNICRSPTAEGVFRKQVADAGFAERIRVESAGTHAYHLGEPADTRARRAAERRGYSLDDIQARRVQDDDFERFDLILAMDSENLRLLEELRQDESRAELRRLLEFAGGDVRDVPDPYFGGTAGFEHVLDLVESASRGLLEDIRRRLLQGATD